MNYISGSGWLSLLVVSLLSLGGVVLAFWVQYLIIKAAVRNGIGEAMAKYGLGRGHQE